MIHMVRHWMLVLAVLLISRNVTFSQDHRVVDSIDHVFGKLSETGRFDPLCDLVLEHINRDNQLALNYILEAEKRAILSNDTLKIVKIKCILGFILKMLGKSREALSLALPLLETTHLKRFPHEYYGVLNLVGTCYTFTDELDKALKYQYLEYESAESNNDRCHLTVASGNIGLTYYKLKNYRKASVFMKESMAFQGSGKISYPMLIYISLCYTHLQYLDSAQMFLDGALEFCGDGCPRPWHGKYATGLIHYQKEKYQQAEGDFLAPLDQAKKGGDVGMQMDNIYLLANIYIQNNYLKRAGKYLEIGETLIQSRIPYSMKAYDKLAELYRAVRNFEKASFYQMRYIELRDSIYNESMTNSLNDIESRHDERMSESRMAEQIIQLNKEIIDRQDKLNVLTATVVILVVVFVISLVKRYRKEHELNALLDRKVQERTSQLEVSRRELLRALRQREQMVMRTASLISEKVNMLKGISSTARENTPEPWVCAYVEKIDSTAKQIDAYVRIFLKNSKAGIIPEI